MKKIYNQPSAKFVVCASSDIITYSFASSGAGDVKDFIDDGII